MSSPFVAILMGSKSDLEAMQAGAEISAFDTKSRSVPPIALPKPPGIMSRTPSNAAARSLSPAPASPPISPAPLPPIPRAP